VTTPIRPGDFAVVNTGTRYTRLITGMEKVADVVRPTELKWTDYDHAVICTGVVDRIGGMQDVTIVEAQPGGAVEVPWHYGGHPFKWSSGIIKLTDDERHTASQAAIALAAAKVGYGWLDYAALVAHDLHIPVPGLRNFIGDTHRLICSQLVDLCYNDAGCELFTDKRWFGYVMPSDLGSLLSPTV
jgi:hypothetical protein